LLQRVLADDLQHAKARLVPFFLDETLFCQRTQRIKEIRP
jgi:hypothetical protein